MTDMFWISMADGVIVGTSIAVVIVCTLVVTGASKESRQHRELVQRLRQEIQVVEQSRDFWRDRCRGREIAGEGRIDAD